MLDVFTTAERGDDVIASRIQRLIESAAGVVGARLAVLIVEAGRGRAMGGPALAVAACYGIDQASIAALEDGLRLMSPTPGSVGKREFPSGSLTALCAGVAGVAAHRSLELSHDREYRGLLFLGWDEAAASKGVDEELWTLVSQSLEAALEGAIGMAVIVAREDEIKALHEIGKEISALAALDRVLHLVCRKAAELIGVEISYVALADKRQTEIRIRMTYGIGESWRNRMWMPFGTGVGGTVAATRLPLIVEEYERFDHPTRADIREMVLEEGIKAVVAVPMLLGDTLTGVLYAADRRAAHFSERDALLLQGLADQAVIAIANSELYEQERREVGRHDRLMAIALRSGDYQELAEALHPLADNPVALYDSRLTLLACHPAPSDAADMGGYDLYAMVQSLDDTKAGRLLAQLQPRLHGCVIGGSTSAGEIGRRVVAPASSGDQLLGYVHIVEDGRELDELDLRLAERAAVILSLRMMRARVEAEVEQRLRGELLDDLLASDRQIVEAAAGRSVHLGHGLAGEHVVAVVEVPALNADVLPGALTPEAARTLRDRLFEEIKSGLKAKGYDAVSNLKGERVVSLVNCGARAAAGAPRDIGTLLTDTVERRHPGLSFFVGVGGVLGDPHEFRRGYEEALICVQVARSRDGTRLVTHQDLGYITLLLDPDHPERLSRFVDDHLGRLLEYDEAHRASLVHTLGTYLDLACNKTAAASALNVHLSTLKYRLERACDLLGLDLSDPVARFEVGLAIKAQAVDSLFGRPRG